MALSNRRVVVWPIVRDVHPSRGDLVTTPPVEALSMRLPVMRFTVRRSMIAVALLPVSWSMFWGIGCLSPLPHNREAARQLTESPGARVVGLRGAGVRWDTIAS
jgi:hypothetical protein